jgi:hypothetical protein
LVIRISDLVIRIFDLESRSSMCDPISGPTERVYESPKKAKVWPHVAIGLTAPSKTGHDLTLSHPLETQLFNGTLCLFHAAASLAYQVVVDTQLNSMVRRLFVSGVRNAG